VPEWCPYPNLQASRRDTSTPASISVFAYPLSLPLCEVPSSPAIPFHVLSCSILSDAVLEALHLAGATVDQLLPSCLVSEECVCGFGFVVLWFCSFVVIAVV